MAKIVTRKKSGGLRKIGRNKDWCKAYRSRGQRLKNKVVKIRRHLKKHPNDRIAYKALHGKHSPSS